MAKIVLSDTAPSEKFTVSTAQVEFEVPYETDDPGVLANARVHPWLKVEDEEGVSVDAINPFPRPEEEIFNANDPELVRAELDRRGLLEETDAVQNVAIQASLDQKEAVVIDAPGDQPDTAQTFAAIDDRDVFSDGETADTDTEGDK